MSTEERIKKARLAARLTQDQLARAVGVSPLTVSRWERGVQVPRAHQFKGISEATGVPLSDLLHDA